MTSDLHPWCALSAASSDLQLSQTVAAVGGASRNKQADAGATVGGSATARVMMMIKMLNVKNVVMMMIATQQ